MNTSNKRLIQLFAFLAAWAFVVVARLVQIQIVRHDDYIKRATRQQERTLSLNPVRGSILDARMRILAESVSADSIYADPQAIVDSAPDVGRGLRLLYVALTRPTQALTVVHNGDLPALLAG